MRKPVISKECADLIDAILNAGLRPRFYSGRNMYGHSCVACTIEKGGTLEGLPKAGALVDSLGVGYIVYWPSCAWSDGVEAYLEIVLDESGRSEEDGRGD